MWTEEEEGTVAQQCERLALIAGMWKTRTDLPDFSALRRELDRRHSSPLIAAPIAPPRDSPLPPSPSPSPQNATGG